MGLRMGLLHLGVGFQKSGDFTPKMDGENHGKTL